MAKRCYLAVDMGASSGRHVAGLFDGEELELAEAYRFANGPVTMAGRMVWDLPAQWQHVKAGMRAAAATAYGPQLVSVGVDTWGVDFGLLGRGAEILGNPYHYRDPRTQGLIDKANECASRDQIFAETGLQFMELNTLYQLFAMKLGDSPLLEAAESLLLMPDLFHWLLTGEKANEQTNVSTTQIYNPQQKAWSASLIEAFGFPPGIFGDIVPPGTRLGTMRTEVAAETGLAVDIVLPGTHDTASAVMAVPAVGAAQQQPSWCYISSGTWSLMGVEVPEPVVTADCARLNFTNEGGVGGTTRLLKNIAGLWLVQECRRKWVEGGSDYSWDDLTFLAGEAPPLAAVINPDDPRLIAPDDMPGMLRTLCRESNQTVPETPGAVIRLALESLALKYRQVLGWLEELVGGRIETIHIVGGGTQNRRLCQMAADACRRRVVAGPVEATAIGNLMMQAVAAGDVASIEQARAVVRESFDVQEYVPEHPESWNAAYAKFVELSPPPE
jgi:rhamnulokinase